MSIRAIERAYNQSVQLKKNWNEIYDKTGERPDFSSHVELLGLDLEEARKILDEDGTFYYEGGTDCRKQYLRPCK